MASMILIKGSKFARSEIPKLLFSSFFLGESYVWSYRGNCGGDPGLS